MKHTWPKPVKPIMKADRACTACGLDARATKYKQTDPGEYHWGVAWSRGEEHGIVEKVSDLPECVPASPPPAVLRMGSDTEATAGSGGHFVRPRSRTAVAASLGAIALMLRWGHELDPDCAGYGENAEIPFRRRDLQSAIDYVMIGALGSDVFLPVEQYSRLVATLAQAETDEDEHWHASQRAQLLSYLMNADGASGQALAAAADVCDSLVAIFREP